MRRLNFNILIMYMPSYNSTKRTIKTRKNSTRRVKSANSSAKRHPVRSSLRYILASHPRTPSRKYTRSIVL